MSAYDDLRNSWKTKTAIGFGQISERDVVGLSKMGYTDIGAGRAFAQARDRQPPNVRNFLGQIGDRAVPINGNDPNSLRMQNGQPAATPYDPLMRALGNRFRGDPQILDKLSRDFQENPGIQDRLLTAIHANPRRAAEVLSRYNGQNGAGPNGARNGNLEQLVNEMSPAPRPTTTPRETPRPVAAAETRQREAQVPPPTQQGARDLLGVSAEPSASVSSNQRNDNSQNNAPSPAASAANINLTVADLIKPGDGFLDTIGSKLAEIFPGMASQIDTFKNQIRGDEQLQQRIVQNLNNNPEFMAEVFKLGQEGEGNSNNLDLLRRFGEAPIRDLLTHPEKLADNAYVDSMTAQLKGASGGIGGMLQNLLGNLDLGGIGGQIMGFLQPLFDMLGDLFRGFGANGGNFMSMGNGSGNMISNFMGNLGSAMHTGAAMRSNERFLVADARVVDRNNDGQITDADKTLEVTDASGNKRTVFETRGLTDSRTENGQFRRAYVDRIDPQTGQAMSVVQITMAADGSVTTADANAPPAGQTPPPPAPPANQDLANRNNTNPAPGGVDMAPNSGLGGIY